MPYIEHTAELTLFGEAVEVPLWILYEYHDRLPAVTEAGGASIDPQESARCEIISISIITRYPSVLGPTSMKTEPADWLLDLMTSDQRGEIENAILEELE